MKALGVKSRVGSPTGYVRYAWGRGIYAMHRMLRMLQSAAQHDLWDQLLHTANLDELRRPPWQTHGMWNLIQGPVPTAC